jgi:hypothetical protein
LVDEDEVKKNVHLSFAYLNGAGTEVTLANNEFYF